MEEIRVGDVLVFSNSEAYDYYIVIHNPYTKSYQMLCPYTCTIMDSFEDLELLTISVNSPRNDYYLVEVFGKNEVELRVINGE